MNILDGSHLEDLPVDIILGVLSYMDTVSLVRCTRLSRAWRNFLLNDGISAFRSFWPEETQWNRTPTLRLWFDRVTRLTRGVLHELRVQEGIIPDSIALQLVSSSAGNLVRLELHLKPKGSIRGPVGVPIELRWNIWTAQRGIDDAVNCVLTSCPNLLHLGLSSPYEQYSLLTEFFCREFVVPPSFSESGKPQLRSLCLYDLKPRYDVHFYRLIERLETLVIAGNGLQRDIEKVWSPAALRVLLRSLERGGEIRTLILEQNLNNWDQAAQSVFAGISEDLLSPDEIDQRWDTEHSASLALQEGLVDDLICDAEGNEYSEPRLVSLPKLEKLHVVSRFNMVSDGISSILTKRNRELSRIVAPRLEDLSIDCVALHQPLTLTT